MYDRTVTFLQFDLKTEVVIESARSLVLPTVTLCNANFLSRRALKAFDYDIISNVTYAISGDIHRNIASLYASDGFSANMQLPLDWMETYWAAVSEYEIVEREIMTKHQVSPDEFSVDQWLLRTGWQLGGDGKSPMIQCRVGRIPCFVEDFQPVLTPQGLCYSLSNKEARFVQKAPGALAGLNVFINLDQEDYTSFNLLGHQQFECGIKVILHDWHKIPDVGQSVGIPPGMSGFVSLEASTRKIDAEPPWSRCVQSKKEHEAIPYSEEKCLKQCEAKQTVDDCGCRLWYEPGNATICGVARTTACLLFKELGTIFFFFFNFYKF